MRRDFGWPWRAEAFWRTNGKIRGLGSGGRRSLLVWCCLLEKRESWTLRHHFGRLHITERQSSNFLYFCNIFLISSIQHEDFRLLSLHRPDLSHIHLRPVTTTYKHVLSLSSGLLMCGIFSTISQPTIQWMPIRSPKFLSYGVFPPIRSLCRFADGGLVCNIIAT